MHGTHPQPNAQFLPRGRRRQRAPANELAVDGEEHRNRSSCGSAWRVRTPKAQAHTQLRSHTQPPRRMHAPSRELQVGGRTVGPTTGAAPSHPVACATQGPECCPGSRIGHIAHKQLAVIGMETARPHQPPCATRIRIREHLGWRSHSHGHGHSHSHSPGILSRG